jgi:hypothetical protein
MDDGASITRRTSSRGIGGAGTRATARDVIAAGAQGIVPLQSAGAQGMWQGAWLSIGAIAEAP